MHAPSKFVGQDGLHAPQTCKVQDSLHGPPNGLCKGPYLLPYEFTPMHGLEDGADNVVQVCLQNVHIQGI